MRGQRTRMGRFVCASLAASLVVVAGVAPGVAEAAFPGRNGKIVFVKRGWAIYVIDANGKHERRVSNRRVGYAANPAWSPNGRTIAFTAYPLARTSVALYTVRSDGHDQRKVGGGADPAWSPDGRQLAFVRNNDLWVVRSNGRGAKRLLESGQDVFSSPAWSPNGKQIAFQTTRPDPVTQGDRKSYIDSIDLGSSAVAELTTSGVDFSPTWSPDGRRIAFHSHRPGASGIWVMNADGSDQSALPTSIQDHEPAWSPDGRKILFNRYPVKTGPGRIFTMNLNGTGLDLVTTKGIPQTPDWGPKPRQKRHRR